jgi:hypothetical protein
MTNKQMEDRIAQLEKTVMELQSQLLTLSLRGYISVPVPNTVPNTNPITTPAPAIPTRPPYMPYIGDPPGVGHGTTLTCGTQSSATDRLARS